MYGKAAPGRWDDHQILFEINAGARQIACSVSVEALEEAGPGQGAQRWQLLEAFGMLRSRIERVALDRYRSTPGNASQIVHVSAADLNDPPPAARGAALRWSTVA
ncbi:MAG: DUF1488 family protein [Rhodospirillales bacterium]|nr:DUF1488 family protein [Rhodospirillales bacterium]